MIQLGNRAQELYRQRGGLPNKITNGIDMRNPELMSVEKTKRNLVKAITELESAWGGSSGDLQRCIAAPTQCGDVDAEEVEALRGGGACRQQRAECDLEDV